MTDFDLTGELPSGTTVIEASAGTGKTYAIVTLATRLIAEGATTIGELLLVTFSRAATQELRERARERFAQTAAALADPPAAARGGDELARLLATHDPAGRRERLLRALSGFDAGTIATTHSFCQRMLDSLGIAGDWQPGARFAEQFDDLVEEVTADLYVRGYAAATEPAPPLPVLRQVAFAAIVDRQAQLWPPPGMASEAAQRSAFARAVRAEVARRKAVRGIRDYDDVLTQLHAVLTDPVDGMVACERIGAQFRVVLVDEFQDTDPLQWDILRRCFHGSTTLVLVGDPKQAIYAFRGAEVLSYLDAVSHAGQRRELALNWRADAGLVAALTQLTGAAALGHPDITVHPVRARHTETRLPGQVPLRLRYFPRTRCGPLNRAGFPEVARMRERVAADVAADIARLLNDPPWLAINGGRDLAARDVAVLVRTHTQVDLVRAALERAGIASVLAGGTSVFTTSSAVHWLWLLHALEQPHRGDRVRLAALTPLIGWTPAQLTAESEDGLSELARTLRELGSVLATAGFAALVETLAAHTGFPERLLGQTGGERTLTDLRQLGQLLHQAATAESLGLTALVRWLTERVQDPARGAGPDRSRRLDSDAAAVQVATVHASKGLEFPVVYIPFGWDGARMPYPETLLLHDEAGNRMLDVGGPQGPDYAQHRSQADSEDAGEQLRLLYVALTRAKCQTVLWWAPTAGTATAPLHRMIFGRPPGSPGIPGAAKVPADEVAGPLLHSWAAGAAPYAVAEAAGTDTATPARARESRPPQELSVARAERTFDSEWRRTSYSALTAAAHEGAYTLPAAGSEVEAAILTDEPPVPESLAREPVTEGSLASPLNAFAGGAEFGTLVHAVLERTNTAADDLELELRVQCAQAAGEGFADIEPGALAAALVPVLHTPLGLSTLTGAVTLASIPPRDRLAELDFELPLGCGGHGATLASIAALTASWLPADDPLAGYPAVLAAISDDVEVLRGYLTGSIDAVLRLPGPPDRFVIVDYKTNRLASGDLTTAHYTPASMAAEMARAHYPLQALLYSVALHRYLRWRLPGYDPAQHLGGAAYLFVRGMAGPAAAPGAGVFRWHPPAGLITELSDLLAARND